MSEQPLCPECHGELGFTKVDRHPGPFVLLDGVTTGFIERQPMCDCGWTTSSRYFPELPIRPLTEEQKTQVQAKIKAYWDQVMAEIDEFFEEGRS